MGIVQSFLVEYTNDNLNKLHENIELLMKINTNSNKL